MRSKNGQEGVQSQKMINRIFRLKSPAILGNVPAFDEPIYVIKPEVPSFAEIENDIKKIYSNGWFTNHGPFVGEFEREISRYLDVASCVCCCNGTLALICLLKTLGLKGEVIVPSFTFVATAEAITWAGGIPVFCDIDMNTLSITPELVSGLINNNTQAIMPVHIYGQPVDVKGFEKLSKKTGIPIIYDSAHAFGSSVDGKKIGNFGLAEAFSFHATKLMTTIEGGAIVTNTKELARELRLVIDFGIESETEITGFGTNAKMNEVSAVVGLHSLRNLPTTIEKRRELYCTYRKCLMDVPGIRLPYKEDTEGWNYHYMPVLIDEEKFGLNRDLLYETLRADNIFARRYFWPPCHRLSAFNVDKNSKNILPVTEFVSNHVLCLPTSSAYSIEIIEKICSVIRAIQDSGERITAVFKKG